MTTRLTIGLESHEVPDAVADAFVDLERRLDAATQEITTLRDRAAAAEQRSDAAQAELRGGVRARVALERAAARVLGDNERFDSLTTRQVQEKAILKVDPSASFENRSDDYVEATFDALVANGANKVNKGLLTTLAVVNAAERSRADALRGVTGGDDDDDDDTSARFDAAMSRYRGDLPAQEDE